MTRLFKGYCIVAFVLSILFFSGCNHSPETLFALRTSDETGIDFSNTISESDSFNIFTYDYIYNGGGVVVADFNNDGLQDIFFTGSMVPNKLYLNLGNMKFKDVTKQAKVNLEERWSSGSVAVDINNDGWQDIYVCATMKEDSTLRGNMLFLNKGLGEGGAPVFEEVASKFGISVNGFSLMASFLDYDKDSDLDLYVLINKQSDGVASNYRDKVEDGSSPNNDFLFRNNGDETFTDVSKQAGIVHDGFGLGLAVADINMDGWPDIYVSNDFMTNDILYVNNRNGTFTNKSPEWLGHHSQFSMGNDVADFNNDGLPDIITMDMLPETNERKKTTINNKNYSNYINNERYRYEYQYIRNMLQLNNGVGFSEIGQLSGVHQTEWSWSTLFADFDNDGLRDIAITNGYPKDITDKDFVTYRLDVGNYLTNSQLLDSVPVVKIPNYAYKNNGDLTFKDVSKEWGFNVPSFSNGAAYADLDNDGDLDYVVNNINENAFVFENLLYEKGDKPDIHFLRVKLKGYPPNIQALGTKVFLFYDSGKMQYSEQEVTRGYLSTVESAIHFGLGKKTLVDSLQIIWPDGSKQKLEKISVDQVLSIAYDPSKSDIPNEMSRVASPTLMSDVSGKFSLRFKHEEDDRIDYNIQRTLPHKFTQSGPGISVGDVNGDKLDDFAVGGSFGHATTLYLQKTDGTFSKSEISFGVSEKKSEDEGLLLFDADGDQDMDLYIVSGSIEAESGSESYQDRLYRNSGAGKLAWDEQALPATLASGSCVRAADFDGDDDLDLFIGGRVVPGQYPLPSESYLLVNEKGSFKNKTDILCPELVKLGMITDGLFTDFNSDGKADLIVVGEYLPVTFFANNNGKFTKVESTGVENLFGWWNSIVGSDFDSDGDIDYVSGNFGLNNGYQVSEKYPLTAYGKDFDKNGSVEAILACYVREDMVGDGEKKLYPVHLWDELNSQSPLFRRKYSRYKQYGKATFDKFLSPVELEGALKLNANYFQSSYIQNLGNGKFKMEALPMLAQIAPINGMVVDDVNNDGNLDVVAVGNDFGNEILVGRLDALNGLILLGDGKGHFALMPSIRSGFIVDGDAKALAKLYGARDQEIFIATQNRDSLRVFAKENQSDTYKVVTINSTEYKGAYVFEDGHIVSAEFYYGSGYLSQSSRKLKIPKGVKEVVLIGYNGKERKIKVSDL